MWIIHLVWNNQYPRCKGKFHVVFLEQLQCTCVLWSITPMLPAIYFYVTTTKVVEQIADKKTLKESWCSPITNQSTWAV